MNKTILEPSREIEVIKETDVLVVGSGPGGLPAAVSYTHLTLPTNREV